MLAHTPAEIKALLDAPEYDIQLVDVREPWEYQLVRLEDYDALLVPLGQLQQQMQQTETTLDKNKPVAVICHHGIRSAHACYLLERLGFDTINISGGIDRWAQELDPSMPLY